MSIEDQDQKGNKFKRMNQILRKGQERENRKKEKLEAENRTLMDKNLHQIYKENKSINEETQAGSQKEMREAKGQTERKGQIEMRDQTEKINKMVTKLR